MSMSIASMFRYKLFDINCLFLLVKHVVFKWYVTNGPILLIRGVWKKEFRENFGAILDFPGIPNESKS